MIKKIISLICAIAAVFCLCTPANAYQISGFELNAGNALLVSLDNGMVVYEKNANERIFPASITKIMTALVIMDNVKDYDNEKIPTSYYAIHAMDGTGSTMLNLKVGEELTPRQSLYALLMCSAADCGMAAAEYYGGDVENFVKMMNDKAKELGMNDTHFMNVHGLHDDNHYTTVNDVYKMTKAALKYDIFMEIVSSSRYRMAATNLSGERTLVTTNYLQDANTAYYYRYAKGVKTGYTDKAGRCLVTTATKNGYSYLCIVMNCPPRNEAGQLQRKEFTDSKNLYEWVFNNYNYKLICDTSTPIGEAPVELCKDADHVSLVLQKDFSAILPKLADDSTITYDLHLKSESFDAPIKAGDVLGTVDIKYANEVLDTVNVVAGQNLERSGVLAFIRGLKNIFTSKVFIFLIAVIFAGCFAFVISSIILTKRARARRRKVKYKRF